MKRRPVGFAIGVEISSSRRSPRLKRRSMLNRTTVAGREQARQQIASRRMRRLTLRVVEAVAAMEREVERQGRAQGTNIVVWERRLNQAGAKLARAQTAWLRQAKLWASLLTPAQARELRGGKR